MRQNAEGYAARLAGAALATLASGTLAALSGRERAELVQAIGKAVDVAYSDGFEDACADAKGGRL